MHYYKRRYYVIYKTVQTNGKDKVGQIFCVVGFKDTAEMFCKDNPNYYYEEHFEK